MGRWITVGEGDEAHHLYIGDGGKVLATRAAISKASGGTERGKALAARSKAAILKGKRSKEAKPAGTGSRSGSIADRMTASADAAKTRAEAAKASGNRPAELQAHEHRALILAKQAGYPSTHKSGQGQTAPGTEKTAAAEAVARARAAGTATPKTGTATPAKPSLTPKVRPADIVAARQKIAGELKGEYRKSEKDVLANPQYHRESPALQGGKALPASTYKADLAKAKSESLQRRNFMRTTAEAPKLSDKEQIRIRLEAAGNAGARKGLRQVFAPQPPARDAATGVAAKPNLPPREERPGYKATFGTRGGQTVNRGLHAEELRGARQIMVNRDRHDYSKLVPSFKPQAKAAASEAKATALEKQATQDYGRNPKLAEAGFSAAKKLRAEAKGRDPQLFSGPPKQAEKGDRAMRLADAREGVKVRAANRAYALAKERGIPVAERVRGSEYRNLRADVLKSGRASLARATPDAAKRIEAGKALAEKRLPDRFPLFLKNPATSQAKPPAPSLREQAATHRTESRAQTGMGHADDAKRQALDKKLTAAWHERSSAAEAAAAAKFKTPAARYKERARILTADPRFQDTLKRLKTIRSR